jgi:hypothetical protein
MKKFKLILPTAAFIFAISGAFASSSLSQLYAVIGGVCKPVACDSSNQAAPLCSQVSLYITSDCTGAPFSINSGRLRVVQ